MTKYQIWYSQIIARAKARKLDCYSEWHHIVPRALGGNDAAENLVQLTYREHFLVHWLLTKIYTGRGRRAMQYALVMMGSAGNGARLVISWQYEVARRAAKVPATAETRHNISLGLLNRIVLPWEKIAKHKAQRRRRKAAEVALQRTQGSQIRENVISKANSSHKTGCYRKEELEVLGADWLRFANEKALRRSKPRFAH